MRYLAIGLIVLLAAGVWGYQKFLKAPAAMAPGADAPAAAAPKPAAPSGGAAQGMPVEAEVVKAERIAQEIIAVGSLRSNESVTLSSGRVNTNANLFHTRQHFLGGTK
jgi:membrane fusion protein (multidrug efflux system)